MTSLNKKIVSAVSLGLLATGAYFLVMQNKDFVFCNPKGECVTYTQKEFDDTFTAFMVKKDLGGQFTMDEYKLYVAMYDYAIKSTGVMSLSNVSLSKKSTSSIWSLMDKKLKPKTITP